MTKTKFIKLLKEHFPSVVGKMDVYSTTEKDWCATVEFISPGLIKLGKKAKKGKTEEL